AFGITPYAAVQAQSFRTPTYSETDVNGGGFALTYNTRTAHDVRSELGARFDHVALVYPGAVLTLRGRLAWAHDWVSDPSLAAAGIVARLVRVKDAGGGEARRRAVHCSAEHRPRDPRHLVVVIGADEAAQSRARADLPARRGLDIGEEDTGRIAHADRAGAG